MDPALISTYYKAPKYSAATMQPISLMMLDQELPMGVFNHDSNLLSMAGEEEELNLLQLEDLDDHELDMLELMVDGDTEDFMKALELLELKEEIVAAEETTSLNTLSSETEKGKYSHSLTNIVESIAATELKATKKSKKNKKKKAKKNPIKAIKKTVESVEKKVDEGVKKAEA